MKDSWNRLKEDIREKLASRRENTSRLCAAHSNKSYEQCLATTCEKCDYDATMEFIYRAKALAWEE